MFDLINVMNNTKEQYFNTIYDNLKKINGYTGMFALYKDLFLNIENKFIYDYVDSSGAKLFLLNCIHTLNRIANAKAENGLDYAKEDKLIAQLEKIKMSSRYVSL